MKWLTFLDFSAGFHFYPSPSYLPEYRHYVLKILSLMSMGPWAAAKKALCQCGGSPSSCTSSQPTDTRPERQVCRITIKRYEVKLETVQRSPDIYLSAEESLNNLKCSVICGHDIVISTLDYKPRYLESDFRHI